MKLLWLLAALALALPPAASAKDLSKAFALARQASAKTRAERSSLSLGRCALGPAQICFEQLALGLAPEDRPYVRLSGGKVFVDPARRSLSTNFQALQRVANAMGGKTVIEVLTPRQSLNTLGSVSWPATKLQTIPMPMGSPRTNSGFEGYTFFPYAGKLEQGILYSDGPYTLVAVNTDQLNRDTVTESIHHELRHVLLGGFGRTALKAKHGLPAVEQATRQAEDEAKRFEKTPLAS